MLLKNLFNKIIGSKLSLCLIGLICFHITNAQIVNMESQRYHTDTTGWSGTLSGNLSLTNSGQNVFAANVNAHAQYQAKKNLYLLLGSYGFLKSEAKSFIDNAFIHFRYNHKLGDVVRLEAFTQLQENKINKIESRFLTGAGFRFKVVSTKKVRLYVASLAMYETEKEQGKTAKINDWRNSSYCSFTYFPNEQTVFITTTYYQPVFVRFKDYRVLNESSFKIKANKKIAVTINWSYQFDSSPADQVQQSTYSLSTGIELGL
ncbi:hypothetical protein BH11BAC3_BH11BAC3_17200 [soil metagenome]